MGSINRQGRIILFRLLCGVRVVLLGIHCNAVYGTVCNLVGLRMDKQKVLGICRKDD